jgi:capsular polysaccharide biosynthesis protein
MRLEDYLGVLRKRWWVIGLIALSAAIAAYGFSWLQTPLFKVRTEYSVRSNRIDSGVALIGGERVFNDYRNRVYNPDRLQGVAQQLQLDKTGTQMMEFVRVQVQPAESRFVIETEYYDPPTAEKIAAAVGDQLNAVVVESNRIAIGEDRVSLERTLRPTYMGYTPNKKINMLAGGILGLVLGVLVAFVLEYMDDTLKTSADVERYSDLPTIGSIPSAVARGGRVSPRLRAAPTSGIVAQSVKPKGNEHHDQ